MNFTFCLNITFFFFNHNITEIKPIKFNQTLIYLIFMVPKTSCEIYLRSLFIRIFYLLIYENIYTPSTTSCYKSLMFRKLCSFFLTIISYFFANFSL